MRHGLPCWQYQSINATPILQANIIIMEKIPYQFRANWRMAVAEVNQACMLPHPQKKQGAEISIALLPSMLLWAPSAAERMLSTQVKMGTTFGKFFTGEFRVESPCYRFLTNEFTIKSHKWVVVRNAIHWFPLFYYSSSFYMCSK